MKIIIFALLILIQVGTALDLREGIQRLIKSGEYKIETIEKNILKIEHVRTGSTKYVKVEDNHMPKLTSSEDMQVFDLINTPDSLFEYKYEYKSSILVAGGLGYPLVIGDFNKNGKLDFAGIYKVIQDYEIGQAGIAELQENGKFTIEHLFNYNDSVVTPLSATDLDNDGRIELNIRRAQDFYNFESTSDSTLPDSVNFIYRMWEISGAVSSETFVNMDHDNFMDLVYVGDDSTEPYGQKIFVAEYDPVLNNFIKRYSYRPKDWRVSGISTGDFDGDGYQEFVTGSIHGKIYLFENTGDNNYEMTYNDSVDTPNAYLTCATNDIDHNGKTEFFIGGSSYYNGMSGTRVYWFESNGNDSYTKIRSFFLLGTGVLGTTELYSYDANADGKDDLVFAFDHYVIILVWNNAEENFDLFYLNYINLGYSSIQSVNIYDVSNDGRPDLLISIYDYWNVPRVQTYYLENLYYTSITYSPKILPSELKLLNNYPNPFNNTTTIPFIINVNSNISLKIYNILGKEVQTLISNKTYSPGRHKIIWAGTDNNGKDLSTGLYFIELTNNKEKAFKKLLLMR